MDGSAVAYHPAQAADDVLLAACDERHARRRGPGGQHRNKTESAVVLRHIATGVEAQASERRSQAENRQVAIKRLRVNLALQVRTAELATAAPTALWKSRLVNGRMLINENHADFGPLLAEALDVVLDRHGQMPSASAQLGCTVSQLVKLLKLEPRALVLVNQVRQERGLHPLV